MVCVLVRVLLWIPNAFNNHTLTPCDIDKLSLAIVILLIHRLFSDDIGGVDDTQYCLIFHK